MIAHIIGAFVAGGAERFVVDLLCAMKDHGNDVHLLVLSNRKDASGEQLLDSLIKSGVGFTCGPTKTVRLKSILWLTKNLTALNPSIIHLHTPNTELAYFFSKRFLTKHHKIVRTIHNTNGDYSLTTGFAFERNKAFNIACSEAVKLSFYSKVDKIIAINNGVNFTWSISEGSRKRARVSLGLDGEINHYLFVGRLSGETMRLSQKSLDILVPAWKQFVLKREGKKLCLHIIGDGNLKENLLKESKNDNTIKLYGIRSDVHEWMVACDYFVMPSRHEGMPISGIEAVGSGMHCIFSKIKPLLELKPDSVSWVESVSVQGLLEAFLESSVLHRRPSEQQIIRSRKRFAIQKTANLYTNQYNALLSDG